MKSSSTPQRLDLEDRTALDNCEARVGALQQLVVDLSDTPAVDAATARIVHEVAQPVTAAANYLAVAEHLLSDDTAISTAHALDAVKHAQQCLVRTGDIMANAKDTAAQTTFEPHRLDLSFVVAEVMALFAHFPELVLAIEISAQAQYVMGEPTPVGQVLANLVRNAIEATEGQAIRRLRITSCRAEDGFVEIRVEDNGPGIARQRRGRLFAASPSTKKRGSGIGLSICRTIVEKYQGRIWADSLPNGTAFCFTLPGC